jgi:ABC-type Na+ transport system ATPase subunit NatA
LLADLLQDARLLCVYYSLRNTQAKKLTRMIAIHLGMQEISGDRKDGNSNGIRFKVNLSL